MVITSQPGSVITHQLPLELLRLGIYSKSNIVLLFVMSVDLHLRFLLIGKSGWQKKYIIEC